MSEKNAIAKVKYQRIAEIWRENFIRFSAFLSKAIQDDAQRIFLISTGLFTSFQDTFKFQQNASESKQLMEAICKELMEFALAKDKDDVYEYVVAMASGQKGKSKYTADTFQFSAIFLYYLGSLYFADDMENSLTLKDVLVRWFSHENGIRHFYLEFFPNLVALKSANILAYTNALLA